MLVHSVYHPFWQHTTKMTILVSREHKEELAVSYLLNSLTYDKHEHNNVWEFFSPLFLTLRQSHIQSLCCLNATLQIDCYTKVKCAPQWPHANCRRHRRQPKQLTSHTPTSTTHRKTMEFRLNFVKVRRFLFWFTLCSALAHSILLRLFFYVKNFERTNERRIRLLFLN